MKKKVLITAEVHPVMIEEFEKRGYIVDYRSNKMTTQEVSAIIRHYHGIIVKSNINMNAALIDKGALLEFIGRPGSGVETIDVKYAQQKGIPVYRSPEGNCNAVAEHALGMLLALINNFRQGDSELRSYIWRREENRGIELQGRTVGIYGFGNTGRSFAEKLKGFNVKVLAYDKYKTDFAKDLDYVTECTLDDIFKQAEIISFHVPLTEFTQHLVCTEFLEKFVQLKVVINTSRGGVVKTDDLVAFLQNGKLTGACLDVFENEKPTTYSENEEKSYKMLYSLQNIIVTPHIAGWTQESKYKMATILIDKIFSNRQLE